MGAIEQLIAKARLIKTESADRANTAMRVGGWMEEVLQYLQDALSGKADAESDDLLTQSHLLVGAINEIASLAGMSEERYDDILNRITALTSQLSDKIDYSEKGEQGGVATLDSEGHVPDSQIDVILEYDSSSLFPQSGKAKRIYVDKSDSKMYRWDGSAYVPFGGAQFTAGEGIRIEGNVISNTHTNITDEEITDIINS